MANLLLEKCTFNSSLTFAILINYTRHFFDDFDFWGNMQILIVYKYKEIKIIV